MTTSDRPAEVDIAFRIKRANKAIAAREAGDVCWCSRQYDKLWTDTPGDYHADLEAIAVEAANLTAALQAAQGKLAAIEAFCHRHQFTCSPDCAHIITILHPTPPSPPAGEKPTYATKHINPNCIVHPGDFPPPPAPASQTDHVEAAIRQFESLRFDTNERFESGFRAQLATVIQSALAEQQAEIDRLKAERDAAVKELQHIAIHHIGTTYPVPANEPPLYIQNRQRMGEYEDQERELTAENAELKAKLAGLEVAE